MVIPILTFAVLIAVIVGDIIILSTVKGHNSHYSEDKEVVAGCLLAERVSRLNAKAGAKLTSHDKLMVAVDWVRTRAAEEGADFDAARVSQKVEIHLERGE